MNQAEYKIRNLESQILYLQQEHASTLKLLHEEIKDLQMKNSETSLQLAMLNINSKDCEIEKSQTDNNEFLEHIDQLKLEIDKLNSQLSQKVSQLEDYHIKFTDLSTNISKLKVHHKTEIAAMETELSIKSAEIVNLSAMLLKSLEQPKSSIDGDLTSPKSSYVTQSPIVPKTFKFRNQISVHPDNVHLRRRPIIARQTMVSTSVPIKSSVPQPSFPEYAVSVEDRAAFTKSIRRPSILPPIQSSRNHSNHDSRRSSLGDTQNSSIDLLLKRSQIQNHPNNHQSPDQKLIQVEVDHLLDINHSGSMHPSTHTVNCNLMNHDQPL